MFGLSQQYDLAEPWPVDRALVLLDWIDDGSFQEIVDATEPQRRSMAARVETDPKMQQVIDATLREAGNWVASYFGSSRSLAGRTIRRMVYDHAPPTGTRLEPVTRVELVVTKVSASQLDYAAALLFRDRNDVKLATVRVPALPSSWDDAPAELRADYIRHGGKKVVRLLYPATAATAT
jgi:hypothetical protein